MALEVEKDGRMEGIEDLDDIFDQVLLYNRDNMAKTPPVDAEVEELIKARIISELMEDFEIELAEQHIPWEIYLTVMRKFMRQKKALFRDIIKSGIEFKYILYLYLDRMFVLEQLPDESARTWLTKIWKRKGPRSKLKNNRFIHNKDPISKLMEKVLVQMIAEKLEKATPLSQAGSRPGRSTRDQLIKLVVLQKYFEKTQTPLPILFVDVAACFDRIRLNDVVSDALKAGADRKTTRMIHKFSEVTEIMIRGDEREKGVMVKGTMGQGSNFAPPSIGLTTSKAVMSQFGPNPEEIMASAGSVTLDPCSYVDDIEVITKNEEGLRRACQSVGRWLQTICLESHPDKSEVVVSGRLKKAADLRLKLMTSPAIMQGFPVKVADTAMYLGMKVNQTGFRQTIDSTVRHRVSKAWDRAREIKIVIDDPRMRRLGWLRAGITLFRAVIIPAITYSCKVWADMYRYTRHFLETEYKAMLYVILDIPTSTKFTSVLADMGLPSIMSVVNKLMIGYTNHTLWSSEDTTARDLLREEKKIMGESSFLSSIDNLCNHYGIPMVSSNCLDRRLVKSQIKLKDEIETWMSNLRSPVTQNVGLNLTRPSTNFFKLTQVARTNPFFKQLAGGSDTCPNVHWTCARLGEVSGKSNNSGF